MAQYCGRTTMDCSVCQLLQVTACPVSIDIQTGLIPDTLYYIWIQDKFGNLFYDFVQTDSRGSVTILTDNFPAGIFSSTVGPLTFFVTVDATPINLETLNFTPPTNCVIITTLPFE